MQKAVNARGPPGLVDVGPGFGMEEASKRQDSPLSNMQKAVNALGPPGLVDVGPGFGMAMKRAAKRQNSAVGKSMRMKAPCKKQFPLCHWMRAALDVSEPLIVPVSNHLVGRK